MTKRIRNSVAIALAIAMIAIVSNYKWLNKKGYHWRVNLWNKQDAVKYHIKYSSDVEPFLYERALPIMNRLIDSIGELRGKHQELSEWKHSHLDRPFDLIQYSYIRLSNESSMKQIVGLSQRCFSFSIRMHPHMADTIVYTNGNIGTAFATGCCGDCGPPRYLFPYLSVNIVAFLNIP